MSDSALDQATFLPLKPPKESILDYSGSLSGADATKLEQQVQALPGLKAKVVVLPKDYAGGDVDALGIALARRWHVGGERMLMVIDLPHHRVRLYPSKYLELRGLTPDVIKKDILGQQFIPYMKQGDLVGAIQNSLTAMSTRVTSSTAMTAPGATQQYQSTPTAPPYAGRHESSFGGLWLWVVGLALLGGAMYMFSFRSRKKDNIKLADSFKDRVGPLYEKADQIGAASEYLQDKDHPELAQRIAQFFNKLTTLEKAVNEVSAMEKRNQVWKVRDGYVKLMRLVALLEPEADALKTDVNALTGGVETVPEMPRNAPIEPAAAQSDAQQKVTVPERFRDDMQYRRPDWTYQPAYSQPVNNSMSSLMMLGMMINQMEMNSRLNQMTWNQGGGMFGGNQNQDNWNTDQGGSNQDNNAADAGWGDTSSGGGFGDVGADWGGGGDAGGGGDFGSSGGDW